MLRLEIRPQRLYHKNVGVNGLHRQKATQSPPASPAHNEIQSRDFGRTQTSFLEAIEIPFPSIVHEEIDLNAFALTGSKCRQFNWKLRGLFVSQHQQGGAAPRDLAPKGDTGSTKMVGLRDGAPRVVLSETENRDFLDAERLTCFEERNSRRNAVLIPFLLRKPILHGPSPVTVGNEAHVTGDASSALSRSIVGNRDELSTH